MGAGLAKENKRGGGRKSQTGWQAQQRDRIEGEFRPERYQARPTAWERKVRQLGLTEASATALIGAHESPGPMLREYVRKIFARRYVPEIVLEAMGLQGEVQLARGLSIRAEANEDE
jgi:hypothetical protein